MANLTRIQVQGAGVVPYKGPGKMTRNCQVVVQKFGEGQYFDLVVLLRHRPAGPNDCVASVMPGLWLSTLSSAGNKDAVDGVDEAVRGKKLGRRWMIYCRVE